MFSTHEVSNAKILLRRLLGSSLTSLGLAPAMAQRSDQHLEEVVVTAARFTVDRASLTKLPKPVLDMRRWRWAWARRPG